LSEQPKGDYRPPSAFRTASVLEARGDVKKDPALELLNIISSYYRRKLLIHEQDQSLKKTGLDVTGDPHFFDRKIDAFQRWDRSRRMRMDNETVLIVANIAWCFSCKCRSTASSIIHALN